MAGPKPILGYPSRTAAALALTDMGRSPSDIAELINASMPEDGVPIDGARVSTLIHSGKKSVKRQADRRTVVIETAVLDALQPEADRRGMSVNALVRDIVSTVAEDGLVAAVLDDGGSQ